MNKPYLITRQTIAEDEVNRLKNHKHGPGERPSFLKEIENLKKPINPDDVDRILGKYYTYSDCQNCEKQCSEVVALDFTYTTADKQYRTICKDCLLEALKLFDISFYGNSIGIIGMRK